MRVVAHSLKYTAFPLSLRLGWLQGSQDSFVKYILQPSLQQQEREENNSTISTVSTETERWGGRQEEHGRTRRKAAVWKTDDARHNAKESTQQCSDGLYREGRHLTGELEVRQGPSAERQETGNDISRYATIVPGREGEKEGRSRGGGVLHLSSINTIVFCLNDN